jgi:ribosomal protein S27E
MTMATMTQKVKRKRYNHLHFSVTLCSVFVVILIKKLKLIHILVALINLLSMPPKLDYSTVKSTIESLGNFKLITAQYEGSSQKLEIQCLTCKNTILKSFADFKRNQCAVCGRNRANEKKRTPISEIESFIKDNGDGDKLVSTSYINEKTPIKVNCGGCQNDYMVTFVNYKHQGGRCTCRQQRTYHTFESVSAFIEKRGDAILSPEYKTIHDYLDIKCGKCHNVFSMTYHYYHNEMKRCACFSTHSP